MLQKIRMLHFELVFCQNTFLMFVHSISLSKKAKGHERLQNKILHVLQQTK